MNILLISEFFPELNSKEITFLGGVQARTYFVAKYLTKKHNLKVISLNKGNIEATASSLPNRLQFCLKTIFTKLDTKPDVIEASNVTTYIPAYILARRLKVPVIAWIPDVLGDGWKTKR